MQGKERVTSVHQFEQQASESVLLSIPHVSLRSDGEPLRLEVMLNRIITPASVGNVIDGITIDNQSLRLQQLFEQAALLRKLPERERPRKVLELFRSQVHYAYNNVMAEVAKDDPATVEWVHENIHGDKPVTLSQIVDHNYAICRHIAVGYLALAHEAGLEGAYATYYAPATGAEPSYKMRNVLRADNQQPLFRSTPIGETFDDGHAWVELKMTNGEWMPVDPTTQLVGDTIEAMQTFKAANYRESVSLDIEGFPPYVGYKDFIDLHFIPGELTHHGSLEINAKPNKIIPPFTKGFIGKVVAANEPVSYEGPLNLSFANRPSRRALNVAVRNVVVSE